MEKDSQALDQDKNFSHCDQDKDFSPCESFDLSTIIGIIYIFIFVFSVIGNGLLIVVLITHKNLNCFTKIFLLNLTCSDLIFTIPLPFLTVYHLHHWIFGDFLCKFVHWMYFVGLYSSIIILMAMTIDRLSTVVLNNWPHNRAVKKTCFIIACVSAWVVSLTVSVYDATKMEVSYDYLCENNSSNDMIYYIQISLLFFLPFAIIIICHCAIIKTVWQAANRTRNKAMSVIFLMVVVYFICWVPYNIVLFIASSYKGTDYQAHKRFHIIHTVFQTLAFSHCFMNPLLCLLTQKFRKHLNDLICRENISRFTWERGTDQNNSGHQKSYFSTDHSVHWSVALDDTKV